MKKVLAVILAAVMVFTLSFGATMLVSAGNGDPTIIVSSLSANRGDIKDVTISLKNNPGIASLKISVAFPSDLSLVSFGDGTHDGNYVPTHIDDEYESTDFDKLVKYDIADMAGVALQPEVAVSPITLNWVNGNALQNVAGDLTFATLRFKIAEDAEFGDKNIVITYVKGDIFNIDEKDVDFEIENGKITVVCSHNYMPEVTPPTCTERGYTTYTCSICNDTYVGDYTDATGHNYVNAIDDKYLKSPADCTHAAVYYKSCSVCGDKSDKTFESGSALGHSFTNYVSDNNATCTADGTKTAKCDRCSETDTIMDVGSILDHKLGEWESDITSHWKTCGDCSGQFEKANHTESDWIIDTPAGIGVDGSKHKACTVCGKVISTESIPALPQPKIVAENKTVRAGETIEINVGIVNNPGIISMQLGINYDSNLLQLLSASAVGFADLSFGPETSNPFMVTWEDVLSDNNTTNGVFVQLKFKVNDAAPEGTTQISVSYDDDNVFNKQYENVPFDVEYGVIKIVRYKPGDVNRDGKINLKDYALLKQYINKWDVDIELSVADVTGDGKINLKDYALLKQYINKWDVVLK